MDFGHTLQFGAFIVPTATDPHLPVRLAQIGDRAGLDLVTFQDHPYVPHFHDTPTLMTWVAATTARVSVAPNVLNVPMRHPVLIAKMIASLDLLSGGRAQLALGAGAYWDAIASLGVKKLTAGQALTALEEAIRIIRGIWATAEPGALSVEGTYHQVHEIKRGPRPAHDIPIWMGAYQRRMLDLVGRVADGWLPSVPYLKPGDLQRGNQAVSEAAESVGRRPQDVRRLLNVGHPDLSQRWIDELARLALDDGISTFITWAEDERGLAAYGEEIAPAVREMVAAERGRRSA